MVILYGLQAVRFKIVDNPEPLATRLGKARLKDLFRGPDAANVSVCNGSSPVGALALTMGSEYHSLTTDGDKRPNGASMATALADMKECMLLSVGVDDAHARARRQLRR